MAKYCPNCGKEIVDGADICLGCGRMLNENNAVKVKSVDDYANSGLTFGLISLIAWFIPLFGYPITIIVFINHVRVLNHKKIREKLLLV